MLKREKVPHNVLNAKFHMQEAEIVQRAGQAGTVTISTNMAGHGTDIKLGEGPADAGGLFLLGTAVPVFRRGVLPLFGTFARPGLPGGIRFYVLLQGGPT